MDVFKNNFATMDKTQRIWSYNLILVSQSYSERMAIKFETLYVILLPCHESVKQDMQPGIKQGNNIALCD